jgi:carbonic anhydrase
MLHRIQGSQIIITFPQQLTPFCFPIKVDSWREDLSSEKLEERVKRMLLGCSDSRVPAEIIFDQGLGDLFVIRVAGNIVAPSQIGSVEFAVERFGTRLVVVLGHSSCGAILATLEELQRPREQQSRNLQSIVGRVRPSVEALLSMNIRNDPATLVQEAVRANIRVSANHLRHGSEILEQLIEKAGLVVVGAEYSLETGLVDFFATEGL